MEDKLSFMAGGGKVGALLRAHAWAESPLGPAPAWPHGLRASVRLMLNSEQPMFLFWGRRRLFFWNDAFARAIGARSEAFEVGQEAPVANPGMWRVLGPQVEQVMKGGGGTWSENQRLPVERDGRVQDAYWTYGCAPIDEDGVPNGIGGALVVCQETTRQVLAERRLANELDRQRELLRMMPGFVCVLDGPNHVFTYVNDAGAAMARGRECIGRPMAEVFPEMVAQGFIGLLDEVYATGRRFTGREIKGRLGAQDPRFVDLLYEPIRDESGEVTGVFVGGYDVTESALSRVALERSEGALRELNEALEAQVQRRTAERDRILRNSHDLITVVDIAGTILAANAASEAILGWRPQEMIGRHVAEFIHPDDMPPMLDGRLIADRYARPSISINRFRHKDGGYRIISWSAGIEDGIVYSYGRDVTLETQQAEALRAAEEALRQSQKMEAVGQLTGGIAHDFNNLLMGIAGNLQLMLVRIEQGRESEVPKYAMAAQATVRRAAALTHRLLAFSRRQTLEPTAVDVNQLLGGMEELIRGTVGPQIELSFAGEEGLWPALVDPNQLENALLNLCINARDAMPEGGKIAIRTSNHSFDELAAQENGLGAGDYLQVCVADTGTGMPPEVIAKAFDPFFTTKPTGMGTGLGLSMIYGFVHQSGGQARIHSEMGQGTSICLFLPRHAQQQEASVADMADGGLGMAKSERDATVLVVDDEPTIRELLAEALAEAGYHVLQAEDGASALRQLEDSSQHVDLLLTDVGLRGGMSGRQLATAARGGHNDLKVLFVTGYTESSAMGKEPLEAGMDVLTKPFEMVELGERIEAMVQASLDQASLAHA